MQKKLSKWYSSECVQIFLLLKTILVHYSTKAPPYIIPCSVAREILVRLHKAFLPAALFVSRKKVKQCGRVMNYLLNIKVVLSDTPPLYKANGY